MTRTELIKRYRDAPAELAKAVEAATDVDRAREGEWSVRQIVNHVADGELMTSARIRRLLAEERPTVRAWDEQEFAERLHSHSRSVRSALALVRAVREVNAELLEQVPEEDWERQAVHSQTGPYTLAAWLAGTGEGDHVREHAGQIRRATS